MTTLDNNNSITLANYSREFNMQEKLIESASFNPKVKSYWVLNAVVICAITIVGIPVLPIVAIITWLISDRMIKAMSAQLFTRKLVVKRGIFFVVEKSIPLEKITDVALSQGPIMRFFGIHGLSFETAGQSGAGALVSLVGIKDAITFRETILAQKDALSGEPLSAQRGQKTNSNHIGETDLNNAQLQELSQSVKNIEKLLQQLVNEKSLK